MYASQCSAFCGRCRNRTYTSGFGDRCSTTKLIARASLFNHKNNQKQNPDGFCFYPELIKGLLLSFCKLYHLTKYRIIFLKLQFNRCKLLAVLSGPVGVPCCLVYQFYEIFL